MLAATVLALASAGLHAGWNLLVKTDGERDLATWGQFTLGAVLVWPVLVVVGLPGWDAVPYLVGSAVVHVAYVTALIRSYGHGDFSLAYPLARVSGALVAAFGGVLLLDDHLGVGAWVSIGVVLLGVVLLVAPDVHGPTIGWALLTGLAIGVYTTIDAAGARRTEGLPYGLTLMSAIALALGVTNVARGRTAALRAALPGSWRRWATAGVFTVTAYTLVLVAVRLAPVGYVATLRESSVLIAALLGWLVLKEQLGDRRTVAAAVMTAGLVALVVTR